MEEFRLSFIKMLLSVIEEAELKCLQKAVWLLKGGSRHKSKNGHESSLQC